MEMFFFGERNTYSYGRVGLGLSEFYFSTIQYDLPDSNFVIRSFYWSISTEKTDGSNIVGDCMTGPNDFRESLNVTISKIIKTRACKRYYNNVMIMTLYLTKND